MNVKAIVYTAAVVVALGGTTIFLTSAGKKSEAPAPADIALDLAFEIESIKVSPVTLTKGKDTLIFQTPEVAEDIIGINKDSLVSRILDKKDTIAGYEINR